MQDKTCLFSLLASLFLIFLNFSFLIFHFRTLPPEVPLFYSRPWGEAMLAPKIQLFFLPLGGLFPLLLNLTLSLRISPQEKVLARILLGTTVVTSVLTTISAYQIINLLI